MEKDPPDLTEAREVLLGTYETLMETAVTEYIAPPSSEADWPRFEVELKTLAAKYNKRSSRRAYWAPKNSMRWAMEENYAHYEDGQYGSGSNW